MRIGLLRHFPVEHPFPTGWRTAAELHEWRQTYDASPAMGEADLGSVPWAHCLSSDLERAVVTARAVFAGDIQHTPLLREAEFVPLQTGNLRLPVLVWRWVLRLIWATGHSSQRACRDDFQRRIRETSDLLETQPQDTLVVSHAGLMIYLSAELNRRGYTGAKLRMPKHATLYLYEKQAPH